MAQQRRRATVEDYSQQRTQKKIKRKVCKIDLRKIENRKN
jgi:hypothetical protein